MEKHVLPKRPDSGGSLLLAAAVVVVLAVYISRARISARAATLFGADIEARVENGELTEEDGLLLAARQRSKMTAKRTLRSLLTSTAAIALSSPFIAPFPLNIYFRPWGELALAVCFGTLLLLLLDSADAALEWIMRRELEKEIASAKALRG